MRDLTGAIVILAGAVLVGAAVIGDSLIVASGRAESNLSAVSTVAAIGGAGLIVVGFWRTFFDRRSPTDASTR
jgi:hypothetical protein